MISGKVLFGGGVVNVLSVDGGCKILSGGAAEARGSVNLTATPSSTG